MKSTKKRVLGLVVVLVLAVPLGWAIYTRVLIKTDAGNRMGRQPAAVKVAPVERGPLELRRTFSGTLEASAKFVLAPKVSGRVERLSVDLADTVERGQVVAELDDDEYIQAVNQARADLEVAKANLSKAKKALEIANREFNRVGILRKRGVASDSQLDEAKANQLANQAQFEVAKAQLTRAQAALETANIRLGYTKVTADWYGGDSQRVVAERFVDEGQTVAANAPLLSIVELSPISGVIFVAEKDYANLRSGQSVVLTTDAYPGQEFKGSIERIAPVFKETSRQARVELNIPNTDRRLKPGMFIRASVVLKIVPNAIIVPDLAVTERNDQTGVFLVSQDGATAVWRPVKLGIRQGKRVQVLDQALQGKVITLGQQLVADGSAITIPDEGSASRAHQVEKELR